MAQYVGVMNTNSRTVGEKITTELTRQDRSQRWLAEESLIPESSLRRKIASGDFTVTELGRIVAALGVPASTILPHSLTGGTK